MKIRLNKFISDCGVASRRKAEEFILEGRVEVNGNTVKDLTYRIEEDDKVTLDGERLKAENKVYFLLNKPKGVVTTTSDEKNRKTVLDLIRTEKKIYPVGRLDYNTTGVLILTNDGNFTNVLTHPAHGIPRIYEVVLNKALSSEHKNLLLKGIVLDGIKSKFNSILSTDEKNKKQYRVETNEGRNHFVKKMFSRLGYKVTGLNRLSFGIFNVGTLKKGEYRKISFSEVKKYLSNLDK